MNYNPHFEKNAAAFDLFMKEFKITAANKSVKCSSIKRRENYGKN
jgi:hypothetical protein